MAANGIGARVKRREDFRLLRGRGRFVGDIAMPGLREVAFVRSPAAHARIRSITAPQGFERSVFAASDLAGVKPIRALSAIPGFKASDYPPLAAGKVRYAGEAVALCIGRTRAEAEDLAQQVALELDPLPAVTDALLARQGGTLVHDSWGDNLFMTVQVGRDIDEIARTAPVTVKREYRMNRQCMAPLEGKGVLAYWDDHDDQLVVVSSTQAPHMIRAGLSEFLGLEQRRIRVIAPDVGGGFGYKVVLQPEELCLAWLAMTRRHPVRWTEDRREHLTAGANTRQHHYRVTAYADARGKILAVDAEITIDIGAYSVWPFTAGLEGAMAGGNLAGPYALPAYRCRSYSVATNKPPFVPYRAVARPGVCFAMELTVDAVARAVGREPAEVRIDNLVPASAMPYTNVAGKHFDSGDYPHSVRMAMARIDLTASARARKAATATGGFWAWASASIPSSRRTARRSSRCGARRSFPASSRRRCA
jgi:carbon-monoxide dehydrogenase large subunit